MIPSSAVNHLHPFSGLVEGTLLGPGLGPKVVKEREDIEGKKEGND